jgi:hypothetical protein
MAEDVIVTAALCTILGFVLGMIIGRATSPKTFNPLQLYRARIQQILSQADKQSTAHSLIQKFDAAWSEIFPDNNK